MGEETKVVTRHYPVEKLPEELRKGLEAGSLVRVTVEADRDGTNAAKALSVRELLGSAPGVYSDPDDAVAHIRALRDEWDGRLP